MGRSISTWSRRTAASGLGPPISRSPPSQFGLECPTDFIREHKANRGSDQNDGRHELRVMTGRLRFIDDGRALIAN
ncbi:conserved hypothetical protein [Mesorhizobium plurifarium]|uniref:Uncharacterized protein n=1 Tax=Mesorhizobium plurifarium TaxID=69974 RepID=A0A090E286_MESPL|nr:conserved hypothetical protein [Mesorhizobium plurifarium]